MEGFFGFYDETLLDHAAVLPTEWKSRNPKFFDYCTPHLISYWALIALGAIYAIIATVSAQ